MGGAILLSFFLSGKYSGDPRIIRDFFFFAFSISSVFFGVKKSKVSYLCLGAVFFCFFYTNNMNSIGWIYQFCMVCAGVICFHQLYHDPLSFKQIRFILIILGTVSSIWGILNYVGIEPLFMIVKPRSLVSYPYGLGLIYKTGQSLIIGFPDLGTNPIYYYPDAQMSGPLVNHTLSSVYPAIALCLGGPIWLIPLWIAGLFTYSSTMSILAAIIGVVHFQLDKRDWFKWYFYLIGGAVLIFLFGRGEFFSGQERLEVWKNIFKWSALQDGMGGGLGFFHDNYSAVFRHVQLFIHEHNEYLFMYTSFGVFGLILSGIAVYLVLKQNASRQKSATISFLFLCVGSFPLHISSLAIIFIMLYTLTIQGDNLWRFQRH